MATLSDGSTDTMAVLWTGAGGHVSTAGRYHASAAPGQFAVIGRVPQSQVADTAIVTIRDTTGPLTLTAIRVSPDTVTLDPGAVQVFTAMGHYSDGSSGPIAANWMATGGAVSPGGTYTAGPTAGSYRVIVTGAGLVDSARVTITDTTTAPPPPAGTVLVTEGFDNASVSGRGWYDNTNPAIATSGQRTGAGALQMAFLQGATTAVQGGAMRHKFTGTDRVYVRYWVRYSSSWIGSGVTYHPHEFHFTTNADGDWVGPSATHLTTYVEHSYTGGGGRPRLALTDALNIDTTKVGQNLSAVTEQRAVAGCNGNTDGYGTNCYQSGSAWRNEKVFTAASPEFTAATQTSWHKVEAYFQLNTIVGGVGQSNGVARYWFDGQLIIDNQDVLFRTAAQPSLLFTQFIIAPYIGVGAPTAEVMWVDDLVIATGPVP